MGHLNCEGLRVQDERKKWPTLAIALRSKEDELVYDDVGKELYAKARDAGLALQVICPSGSKNIFLKLTKTDEGYDNIGIEHPKELCSTLLGRITSLSCRAFNSILTQYIQGYNAHSLRSWSGFRILSSSLNMHADRRG